MTKMRGISSKEQYDRVVAELKKVLASVRFDPSEALAYREIPVVERRRVDKSSNITIKNLED
ncbi:MAG TPA: hypothetical protein PK344_14705 [Syntrophorhabdaceae bacterium]|nr:hypothetical protein [Syntrophorhabdaceae bacterium]